MLQYRDDSAEFFARMTVDEAARFMSGSCHPIRDLAAAAIGTRQVLDLGCGKGIRIAELYTPEQYTGVDCSSHLIDIAIRNNPQHRFVVSGILDYLDKLADKSVDCALMVAVLEHVPTLTTAQRIYNEARRVANELFVGWHTPPNAGKNKLSRVKAELNEPIWQNRWQQGSFGGTVQSQSIDHAELWSVRD